MLLGQQPGPPYLFWRISFPHPLGGGGSGMTTDAMIAKFLIEKIGWRCHTEYERWGHTTLAGLQQEKKERVLVLPVSLRDHANVPTANEMATWWVNPVTRALDKTGETEGATIQLGIYVPFLKAFHDQTKVDIGIGQIMTKEEAAEHIAQLNEQLKEYNMTVEDIDDIKPPVEKPKARSSA